MTPQQQTEQPQGEMKTETETETERLLKTGPVRTRQQSITEDTAAFIGVPAGKVFDVLRGIWTVTAGKPPLTDQELMVGMALVARYGLDPFAREIYVTRDSKNRLMTIIGIDGFIRILDRTDHYDGFEQTIFEEKGEITKVVTAIYSTKRDHPAKYTAYMKDYAQLGGFMLTKIPGHMLRLFSLKHAARLFVPLGTVVTAEEARVMGYAEPASDNTAKHIEQARAAREQPPPPPLPPIPPPPPPPPMTATPPFDPPTEAEVDLTAQQVEIYPTPTQQAATAEKLCERISNAVSIANVEQLERDVVKCVEQHEISQTHAAELSELIAAARVRVQG